MSDFLKSIMDRNENARATATGLSRFAHDEVSGKNMEDAETAMQEMEEIDQAAEEDGMNDVVAAGPDNFDEDMEYGMFALDDEDPAETGRVTKNFRRRSRNWPMPTGYYETLTTMDGEHHGYISSTGVIWTPFTSIYRHDEYRGHVNLKTGNKYFMREHDPGEHEPYLAVRSGKLMVQRPDGSGYVRVEEDDSGSSREPLNAVSFQQEGETAPEAPGFSNAHGAWIEIHDDAGQMELLRMEAAERGRQLAGSSQGDMMEATPPANTGETSDE